MRAILGAAVSLAVLPLAVTATGSAPPPSGPQAGVAASYDSPPPVLDPAVFATVPADLGTADGLPYVAGTADGGAVVLDPDGFVAVRVGADGTAGEMLSAGMGIVSALNNATESSGRRLIGP